MTQVFFSFLVHTLKLIFTTNLELKSCQAQDLKNYFSDNILNQRQYSNEEAMLDGRCSKNLFATCKYIFD